MGIQTTKTMSSVKGLQVEGLSRTIRQMKKLGAKSEDLKAAWQKAEPTAMGALNRFTPVRTGNLKASNRPSKRETSLYLYSGNNRQRKRKGSAFYAPFVQWGPQYTFYATRAVQSSEGKVVGIVDNEMQKIIDRLGF